MWLVWILSKHLLLLCYTETHLSYIKQQFARLPAVNMSNASHYWCTAAANLSYYSDGRRVLPVNTSAVPERLQDQVLKLMT